MDTFKTQSNDILVDTGYKYRVIDSNSTKDVTIYNIQLKVEGNQHIDNGSGVEVPSS